MSKIVIIDDEIKITQLLSERIEEEGHSVTAFSSGEEALPFIERGNTDIVLCDLRLGGMNGLELLKRAKRVAPVTDFVMMTAYASASTAVEAMREGAYEYLIKPFQMEEVVLLLRRIQDRRDLVSENLALRERISDAATARRIVGESPAIRSIREMILKVGPSDAPVLVQGESGTGKELVAAEIHMSSTRAKNPFIVINCAAVPDTLIESELFGYDKGAFTGASHNKPGMFKLADTGTLFLDEIGDLSLGLQAKLLRAIETGEFIPLGASKSIKVDVRIVAATNQDLEELAAEGRFREDLFYRLNVFPIRIQPLRERREDIIPITESFLISWKLSSNTLSREVHEKLMSYDWPGNVRELRNILERAVILAGQDTILPEHITIVDTRSTNLPEDRLRSIVGERTLPEIEKIMIELALERTGGNKSRAAEILGITRRTLYGRLEKLEEEKESTE
jgi:DNA-binding NtrC family response regulator